MELCFESLLRATRGCLQREGIPVCLEVEGSFLVCSKALQLGYIPAGVKMYRTHVLLCFRAWKRKRRGEGGRTSLKSSVCLISWAITDAPQRWQHICPMSWQHCTNSRTMSSKENNTSQLFHSRPAYADQVPPQLRYPTVSRLVLQGQPQILGTHPRHTGSTRQNQAGGGLHQPFPARRVGCCDLRRGGECRLPARSSSALYSFSNRDQTGSSTSLVEPYVLFVFIDLKIGGSEDRRMADDHWIFSDGSAGLFFERGSRGKELC